MPKIPKPVRPFGIDTATVQGISLPKAPKTSDGTDPKTNKRYELGTLWTDTSKDQVYVLVKNTGVKSVSENATWIEFTGADANPLLTLTGDGSVAVTPDGTGDIDITGTTVANATRVKPVYIDDSVVNALDVEVQVSTERTGAPGDKNDAGLASFDDTAFAVDADGYVTLSGGAGPTIDSINVDGNTGPGTDPVVPDGSGVVAVAGSTVANATNATPLFTHSRAANAYNIEAQVSAAVTGAPADKNDAGLASFDDTQFAVTANGYTTLKGGAGLSAVQTLTGATGGAISPDASGNIDITGSGGIVTSGSGTAINIDGAGIGGAWEFVSTTTISNVATIDFTGLTSSYFEYMWIIDGLVPITTATDLYMRTSTDGGTSYDAGASDYQWVNSGQTAGGSEAYVSSIGQNQIRLNTTTLSTGANETFNLIVRIINPAGTGYTFVQSEGAFMNSTPRIVRTSGAGVRQSAADVDAVRFLMSSGNLSTGTVKLYRLSAT